MKNAHLTLPRHSGTTHLPNPLRQPAAPPFQVISRIFFFKEKLRDPRVSKHEALARPGLAWLGSAQGSLIFPQCSERTPAVGVLRAASLQLVGFDFYSFTSISAFPSSLSLCHPSMEKPPQDGHS